MTPPTRRAPTLTQSVHLQMGQRPPPVTRALSWRYLTRERERGHETREPSTPSDDTLRQRSSVATATDTDEPVSRVSRLCLERRAAEDRRGRAWPPRLQCGPHLGLGPPAPPCSLHPGAVYYSSKVYCKRHSRLRRARRWYSRYFFVELRTVRVHISGQCRCHAFRLSNYD